MRKTVTVLFCTLTDSRALSERLDAEILREILGRFAAAASEAVAWHGGTMEKFIGDAVMAVFGVPRLHEDDALRAVRAADALRERIAELAHECGLQLSARIGIETGEVVAGDAGAGEALATGAAVTTAARLEQEASPGEILLGEATRRLVAATVRVEPRGELALMRKQEGVTAWRLIELLPEPAPFAERLKTPLVGREVELAQLRQSLARAVRERTPHLFTVLGPPGIGKTRLARELAEGMAGEATVLVGRCLSYGEGITFSPLRELLRQVPSGEHRARVRALLDADWGAVAATTEEIFLAARRLLESVARERPLLLLLEDLHWAEPTFLDFIEYLGRRATDTPMLLLCLARPELLELRESWGGGMTNASSLHLEPLADDETDALLDQLRADPPIRAQVKAVAEGNPLFAEQMLAWLEERGGLEHHQGLPPTIQAVLAARLDRLGPAETATVHRAAVVGRDFEAEAVAELLPGEARPAMARHLDALVGKGLVKRLRSKQEEGASFRFVHALVQDAAYRMVPKRLRAELHERFADWLHRAGSPHAEIVGHHLEQAYRYRTELGPIGDAERELALRAGTTLCEAGLHARQHGDDGAAVALLSRGLALLPAGAPVRGGFLMGLGDSCTTAGDYRRAVSAYDDALAAAERAGDRGLAWEAKLLRSLHESFLSPGRRSYEEYLSEAKVAADALEALGHERGLARAWNSVAIFEIWLGHLGAGANAAERAATFAHRVGDWHLERASLSWLAESLLEGPTPAGEGLRRCEEILARADNTDLRSRMHRVLGDLHAMLGHADEARDLHELALSEAEELGLKRRIAAIESLFRPFATTLAPAEAEARLRRSLRLWEEMEVVGAERPVVAATLAWTLCEQGREAEAEQYAALGERLAPADDYNSLSLTRAVRAQVLARKGDVEHAEALAREALAIVDRTDNIDGRGWLRADVADVLTLARKDDEAFSVLEEAVHLAEQKGDVVLVERARARLAELQTSAPLR
jgi:class 3 adenylate cyclase/tetratricopeptide (TPR) repeat protein